MAGLEREVRAALQAAAWFFLLPLWWEAAYSNTLGEDVPGVWADPRGGLHGGKKASEGSQKWWSFCSPSLLTPLF